MDRVLRSDIFRLGIIAEHEVMPRRPPGHDALF
jgi:hypothetical protein